MERAALELPPELVTKIIHNSGALSFEEFVELCIRESTRDALPASDEERASPYVTRAEFEDFRTRHVRVIRSLVDFWLAYWLDFYGCTTRD